MSDWVQSNLGLLIMVGAVFFLVWAVVLRAIRLWYWRVDEIVTILEEIRDHLHWIAVRQKGPDSAPPPPLPKQVEAGTFCAKCGFPYPEAMSGKNCAACGGVIV